MAGPLSETRRSFQTECACFKMAKLSGRAEPAPPALALLDKSETLTP
jgi:hypothetical protein